MPYIFPRRESSQDRSRHHRDALEAQSKRLDQNIGDGCLLSALAPFVLLIPGIAQYGAISARVENPQHALAYGLGLYLAELVVSEIVIIAGINENIK